MHVFLIPFATAVVDSTRTLESLGEKTHLCMNDLADEGAFPRDKKEREE
jgi:hypothetical protein